MKFINFDDIVNKNNENYINKNVFVPQHVSNTVIIGQTGCSKTNLLFNILTLNPIFQKILYLKKFPNDVKIFYQNDEYDLDSLIKGNLQTCCIFDDQLSDDKKLWIGLFVLVKKIVQISFYHIVISKCQKH